MYSPGMNSGSKEVEGDCSVEEGQQEEGQRYQVPRGGAETTRSCSQEKARGGDEPEEDKAGHPARSEPPHLLHVHLFAERECRG